MFFPEEPLELNDNALESLPLEINQLATLTHLSLESNQLRVLPAGIGNLAALQKLNACGNLLESLPSELGKLVRLDTLKLQQCAGLTELPATIGKLQSLRSNKDAVEQVNAPDECGMSFDDFQGMEPEDRVEAYAARDTDLDDDDE